MRSKESAVLKMVVPGVKQPGSHFGLGKTRLSHCPHPGGPRFQLLHECASRANEAANQHQSRTVSLARTPAARLLVGERLTKKKATMIVPTTVFRRHAPTNKNKLLLGRDFLPPIGNPA